jgi:hypothetical protein
VELTCFPSLVFVSCSFIEDESLTVGKLIILHSTKFKKKLLLLVLKYYTY